MTKPKRRQEPNIEREDTGHESDDPVTETPNDPDPMNDNRREPAPIPEEGGRGEHSADDPVTREQSIEEVGQ
jgi:hypothetical protein